MMMEAVEAKKEIELLDIMTEDVEVWWIQFLGQKSRKEDITAPKDF